MAKLPVVSGEEAVKAFEKDGWIVIRRAKGRHIIMKKGGMTATLSLLMEWWDLQLPLSSALLYGLFC